MQKQSHEVLLKLLNNIGIVGSILCGVADIIFVVIFVVGVKVNTQITTTIIFACVNAVIGILINILLRYQGQKYAEIENEELCNKFYRKRAKENKKHLSMEAWFALNTIKDVLMKGSTTVFSIFGLVYISIEGSKNPIQILLTLVTLVMFACFGLINMNSAYYRYYNVQVPYMELKINEKGDNENGTD